MNRPKERPILLSAPMVRAALRSVNPKAQTRRIIKPQPMDGQFPRLVNDEWGLYLDRPNAGAYQHIGKCPYGKPGDRLWVRETFYAYGYWTKHYSGEKGKDVWHFNDKTLPGNYRFQRPADTLRRSVGSIGWFKRPAIFMPRIASRITLEITDVRVQRLQEISEEDAKAEGADPVTEEVSSDPAIRYRAAFHSLWTSINGLTSWGENPWVWALSFQMVAV